jgi:hypothetical protein
MKFRSAHLVDMKIPMFSPRPANGFHAGFTLICAAFFCMGVAVTVKFSTR